MTIVRYAEAADYAFGSNPPYDLASERAHLKFLAFTFNVSICKSGVYMSRG
jgi:hypothetical protein